MSEQNAKKEFVKITTPEGRLLWGDPHNWMKKTNYTDNSPQLTKTGIQKEEVRFRIGIPVNQARPIFALMKQELQKYAPSVQIQEDPATGEIRAVQMIQTPQGAFPVKIKRKDFSLKFTNENDLIDEDKPDSPDNRFSKYPEFRGLYVFTVSANRFTNEGKELQKPKVWIINQSGALEVLNAGMVPGDFGKVSVAINVSPKGIYLNLDETLATRKGEPIVTNSGGTGAAFKGEQASQGFNNPSQGFGAPTQAPSGFGAPQTAQAGFGALQTAPTGFGAPQTAPAGFGALQTAPTGFGAPTQAPSGFGQGFVQTLGNGQ